MYLEQGCHAFSLRVSIWGKDVCARKRLRSVYVSRAHIGTSRGWHPSSTTCKHFVLVVYGLLARIVFSGLKYSTLMRYLSAQEDAGGLERCLGSLLTSLSTAACCGSCCPCRRRKRSVEAGAGRSCREGGHSGGWSAWEPQVSPRVCLEATHLGCLFLGLMALGARPHSVECG